MSETPPHLDKPVECQDSRSNADSCKCQSQNLKNVAFGWRDHLLSGEIATTKTPQLELELHCSRSPTGRKWRHLEDFCFPFLKRCLCFMGSVFSFLVTPTCFEGSARLWFPKYAGKLECRNARQTLVPKTERQEPKIRGAADSKIYSLSSPNLSSQGVKVACSLISSADVGWMRAIRGWCPA